MTFEDSCLLNTGSSTIKLNFGTTKYRLLKAECCSTEVTTDKFDCKMVKGFCFSCFLIQNLKIIATVFKLSSLHAQKSCTNQSYIWRQLNTPTTHTSKDMQLCRLHLYKLTCKKPMTGISTLDVERMYQVSVQSFINCRNSLLHKLFDKDK